MNSEIDNLFVYGSLRTGFREPAYHYLSRYFQNLGEGIVKGKLFDMGSYPVAIPSFDEGAIPGELYTINNPMEKSWAFAQLDDYEGVFTETGETAKYKREITTVYHRGIEIQAWVYWYCGDVSNLKEISGNDLLNYLHQKKP